VILGLGLYVLFAVLATAGAAIVFQRLHGRRAALLAAFLTLLFFVALYAALDRWVFSQIPGP